MTLRVFFRKFQTLENLKTIYKFGCLKKQIFILEGTLIV